MKKSFKIVALLLMLGIAVTAFAGCGGAATIARPVADGTERAVSGTISMERTETGVTVTAETDLMDGVIGHLSITGTDGLVIEKKTVLTNGKALSATFTQTDAWPDVVYGFFAADTKTDGAQSEEVLAYYGKQFQNMKGENLVWNRDGVIFVIQTEALELK